MPIDILSTWLTYLRCSTHWKLDDIVAISTLYNSKFTELNLDQTKWNIFLTLILKAYSKYMNI